MKKRTEKEEYRSKWGRSEEEKRKGMESTNTVQGGKDLKKKKSEGLESTKQKGIERTKTLLCGKRLTENKRKRQQSERYVHESLKKH